MDFTGRRITFRLAGDPDFLPGVLPSPLFRDFVAEKRFFRFFGLRVFMEKSLTHKPMESA